MSARTLNLILLLMLAVAGVLAWSIRKDVTRPNFEFLPDMTYSAAYSSFSPATPFPDGKTLRRPVEHTIARGALSSIPSYQATAEDADRAGRELRNPFSIEDRAAVRRGEAVYNSFCRPCHGVKGAGDGAVVLRGFPAPPPYSSADIRDIPDGRIFHAVTYGGKDMPSHAAQIPPEDRWKVALFVRVLREAALKQAEAGVAPAEEAPPEAGAEREAQQ